MAVLCFHSSWGAPGQESGLPEPTPLLQWALASLGPKYPKIVHSSDVERLVSAVRLPSIWSSGTQALSCRRAWPVCAQQNSPRLHWTPIATKNSSLTLTPTFRSWFCMSHFSWIYFLREFSLVQNSPIVAQAVWEWQEKVVGMAAKAHVFSLSLSFSPTQLALLENHQ